MSTPTDSESVRDQVLQALDPDGQMQRDMLAARNLPPFGRFADLRRVAREREALLDTVERYWIVLTDRGWGVANVAVDLIRQAGQLLDEGDAQAADDVIAGWFDRRWMERTVSRVRIMNDGSPEGRQLFGERARLLTTAVQHHEDEEFAASIFIVLAQTEGITAQVTAPADGGPGKLFFTKRSGRKADVVDSTDLASIRASLDRLRDAYSADVPNAQLLGMLSRHGILHGQELAFDNRANSAKCWSLLDVLVQWAMPRARERAAQADGRRQSVHAGSQELDDRGRRLDDREFKVTRSALYEVCAMQSSHAVRSKGFDVAYAASVLTDAAMARRGLPLPHGVSVQTAPDGRSFWAARCTVSGWWLAKGLTLNRNGFVDVWYFSGTDRPELGPSDDPDAWGGMPNMAPPDWQGGDD